MVAQRTDPLESAQAQIRSLVESIGDPLFAMDEEWRITYFNRHAETLTGHSRDEALGGLAWDLFPEALAATLSERFAEFAKRGTGGTFELFWPVRTMWLDVRAYPFEGGMTAYLCDVTERKRAEAEAAAMTAQRDGFMLSVAHDLKTPLTTIKGIAQLLNVRTEHRTDPLAAQLSSGLARIDRIATHMAAQINALLDVTRIETDQPLDMVPRAIDLVALAREVADEQEQRPRGRHIEVIAEADQVIGLWDAFRLERVLHNLMANALRYSPDGGEVVVRITTEGRSDGQYAVITVSDHGIGIPPRDLPHIFERFYRGSNVAGKIAGTGIGLAGAQQIVEQFGGTITADSQEGIGSTFTVRLPIEI